MRTAASLAAFDELNKLAGEETGSSGEKQETDTGAGDRAEDVEKTEEAVAGLSERLQGLIDSVRAGIAGIKEDLAAVWAVFAQAWRDNGGAVLEAAKNALLGIWGVMKSVGAAFTAIWTNGTGAKILNTIYSIITNVFNLVGVLAERFRIAWEANGNGEAIWQAILNIIQHVLDFINRIVAATLEWARGLNLEPIVSAFRRFLEVLDPFVALLLDGLAWAYENVLLPLASWVIEEAAPAAVDRLSAALDAIMAVIEALKPWALWLWESFLKPLGRWTGELIINAIHWLTQRLKEFSDWARANPEAIQNMAEIILAMLGGILVYQTVHKIAEVINTIRLAFIGFAQGIGMAQKQGILASIAFGAIILAIVELAKHWNDMSGFERVIAVLGLVAAAAFAAAMAIGVFHTAATMGIAVAAIVGGIALLSAAIASAQSRASHMSKSISGSGGGGFAGVSSGRDGTLSLAGVPHLAKGAVIPANREFLAVLGDQKSGTNIEAPVSEIEAAVARGIAQAGGGRGDARLEVNLVLDNTRIGRVLLPSIEQASKARGVRLAVRGTV